MLIVGDSSFFSAGAKENIHTRLNMGNIMSPEGKKIFAGDRKNQIKEFNNIGEGHLIIDKEGEDIERVKFNQITDFDTLYKEIKSAMTQQ